MSRPEIALQKAMPSPGRLFVPSAHVDIDVTGDCVAADGRRLGVVDCASGWSADGRGEAEDRNVALWIQKPEG